MNLVEYYDGALEDFLSFFDGVDEYVIAIERSEVRKGQFHLHAFMSFVEPCLIAELGDYVRSFPVCEQLNIQA